MNKKEQIETALSLLDDAQEFFGPCWCKKSIGYSCPQCAWRADYKEFLEQISAVTKK